VALSLHAGVFNYMLDFWVASTVTLYLFTLFDALQLFLFNRKYQIS